MLSDQVCCEAWPGYKVPGVDGGDPGGRNRAEGGSVELLYDVSLFGDFIDIVHVMDGWVICFV